MALSTADDLLSTLAGSLIGRFCIAIIIVEAKMQVGIGDSN